MKNSKLLLCILTLFLSSNLLLGQSRKELRKQKRVAQYNNTKKLVKSGQYIFMIQWIVSQKGQQTEAFGQGLLVEGDKAYVSVPFMGISNRGEMGIPTNIEFENSDTTYDIEYNDKKRKIIVRFDAKAGNENYQVVLTIMGNTRTTVQITSSARGIMTYEGKIKKVTV